MPQGKCVSCKVAYRWSGRPLLKQAFCLKCSQPLVRTSYLLEWEWIDRKPATFAPGAKRRLR